MIDRNHRLSVTRQARMLGISRASVYYIPRPVSEADLKLMRAMDELHLEYPFAGSRMLRDMLRQDGFDVGRKHVATLMRRMGIEALYRKPRTTRRHPEHRVYPYLLREMDVCQPNQVWAMDITYIPMARGFVYLAAGRCCITRRQCVGASPPLISGRSVRWNLFRLGESERSQSVECLTLDQGLDLLILEPARRELDP